jgi:deoxyribonuclease-1-like protein
MASRKSTSSRKRAHRTSNLSRVIWIVWTLVTGGSVAGWMAPGIPLVGPLVQQLLGNKTVNEILSDERVNGVIALAPDDAWNGKIGLLKKTLAEHKATGQTSSDQGPQVPTTSGVQPASNPRVTPGAPVQKSPDKIGIASYNIQVFGTSKLAKSWIVDILVQVVRRLDIVAIQEVRSKDDQILPQFLAAINADGSRYDFVIGPRLGRTDSKEQYVFVFDTNRIEVDRSSVGTMSDPNDVLHREPLVARFRTRTNNPAAAFTFWMVNIHTDPDEVASEVDVLAGVFQAMQAARADEDDVILLGDLNASEREFGRLGQVPGITWAIRNTTTNTRKNKMYDNILFSSVATTEFTGRWGVADIQTVCGLTLEQALEVSDHFPVWAEFSIWESPPANNTARVPTRLLQ